MSEVNKHGLKRHIPAAIAREVRQRCGFGCIICGCAIYQYEHVDPTFAEARRHDPNNIVLLCGGCHDRASRGLLSKETIKNYAEEPRCLQEGYSFGPFDLGYKHPTIILGTTKAINAHTIVEVLGDPLLRIDKPEKPGAPFLISARLHDRSGKEVVKIERNEWQSSIENWDVTVEGQKITIYQGSRDIALILRSEPPNVLFIERLEMYYRGVGISCKEGKHLRFDFPDGTYHEEKLPTDGKIVVEARDAKRLYIVDKEGFGIGGSLTINGTLIAGSTS